MVIMTEHPQAHWKWCPHKQSLSSTAHPRLVSAYWGCWTLLLLTTPTTWPH